MENSGGGGDFYDPSEKGRTDYIKEGKSVRLPPRLSDAGGLPNLNLVAGAAQFTVIDYDGDKTTVHPPGSTDFFGRPLNGAPVCPPNPNSPSSPDSTSETPQLPGLPWGSANQPTSVKPLVPSPPVSTSPAPSSPAPLPSKSPASPGTTISPPLGTATPAPTSAPSSSAQSAPFVAEMTSALLQVCSAISSLHQSQSLLMSEVRSWRQGESTSQPSIASPVLPPSSPSPSPSPLPPSPAAPEPSPVENPPSAASLSAPSAASPSVAKVPLIVVGAFGSLVLKALSIDDSNPDVLVVLWDPADPHVSPQEGATIDIITPELTWQCQAGMTLKLTLGGQKVLAMVLVLLADPTPTE